MDTEYTLEVWDGITGQWFILDTSTDIDTLNVEAIEGKWRLIKTTTETVATSYGLKRNDS